MSDKIFCGNGKTFGKYGQIGLSVCLSDIPKEHMSKDKNGKTWVKLNVCSKRTPDERSTHYVEVNTWRPSPSGSKEPAIQYDGVDKSFDMPNDEVPF
jgi:hypothetical protein